MIISVRQDQPRRTWKARQENLLRVSRLNFNLVLLIRSPLLAAIIPPAFGPDLVSVFSERHYCIVSMSRRKPTSCHIAKILVSGVTCVGGFRPRSRVKDADLLRPSSVARAAQGNLSNLNVCPQGLGRECGERGTEDGHIASHNPLLKQA